MFRKCYSREWILFRKRMLLIFIILLCSFIATTLICAHYYANHPDKAKDRVLRLGKSFQGRGFFAENRLGVFLRLFLNNLMASFGITMSGIIPFLVLPLPILVGSGFTMGLLIAGNTLFGRSDNLTFLFVAVLPHSFFELLAVIYSSTLGVYLSVSMSKKFIRRYRDHSPPLRILLFELSRSFLLVIIPLLLVAALVETFVTMGK